MKVVILLVGISLIIELGILPYPTSARKLMFTGSCFNPKEGDTVDLKETTFTPWMAAELNYINKQRLEVLKYDKSKEIIHNPKISQYANWHVDRKCENIKKNYGETFPTNYQFNDSKLHRDYWDRVNNSVGITMTECNCDMQHDHEIVHENVRENVTLGLADKASRIYAHYKNHRINYAGLRAGSSLFLSMIKEIGFAERLCSKVRVVSIMSWPALFGKDFNPADLRTKCIVNNDKQSMTSDAHGSSYEWRLRFLNILNQYRNLEGLGDVLLNNELCNSVKWSLLQLKEKPDLKVKTTQGIIDAMGNKDWKVQCEDALLEYNGTSDSNGELDAIKFVDSINANKEDQLYKQLFSKDIKETCATVEAIDLPEYAGENGKWAIGVMHLSRGDKAFSGGTTQILTVEEEEVNETTTETNGVGSHILNLWMISLGVIGLRVFFTFF